MRTLLCKFFCAFGLTIMLLQVVQPYIYQKVMAETMDVHHSLLSDLEEIEVRHEGQENPVNLLKPKWAAIIVPLFSVFDAHVSILLETLCTAPAPNVRVFVLLRTLRL